MRTGRSDEMKWEEMSERERDALVHQAEKIKAAAWGFPEPCTPCQNAILGAIAYRAEAILASLRAKGVEV